MSRRLGLAACGLLAALAWPGAQSGSAPFVESIRQDQMRADLFFLSSDGLQGRLTDTPANAVAGDWVRARFERLGLRPGGQAGSFDHRYTLMTAALGDGNRGAIERDGGRQYLRPLHDFYPHRYSATADVRGEVVFAGFGIVSPERGHDDYRDAVRGKIALVLDREPGIDDPASAFDGVVTSESANALRKALAAQAKGAIGLAIVDDVHTQRGPAPVFQAQAAAYWPAEPPRIERYTLMAWAEQVRIPVVQVSIPVAERLVAGTGRSLVALARGAEARGGVTPAPLPGVALGFETRVVQTAVPDRSVVAVLEGADPALKAEHVLISAHFDHNGADGSGVYNGADDDGSGTVALIDIAEAFALAAEAGQRPKRSVIFAAWNSEERGLLGAWAYTEDPLVPLDRIAGVLNMDMIGRNEEVPVGGGGRFRGLEVQSAESNANATNIIGTVRSPDLKAVIERANRATGLDLRFRYDNNASNLMRRSDHWPFIQRGVPAVWVHTGLHPDYHTIYDDPEKITYGKMERIARMVYQAAWDLANAEQRPRPPSTP